MVLCNSLHIAYIIIKMFSACSPTRCYDLRVQHGCVIMDTQVGFLVESRVSIWNDLIRYILKITTFSDIYINYLCGIVPFHSVYSRGSLRCNVSECMVSKSYVHPVSIAL